MDQTFSYTLYHSTESRGILIEVQQAGEAQWVAEYVINRADFDR